MSKERIYVLCTKKSEYAEVLKYKARNGHVWRQSQKPVLCNNENIREWDKYSNQSVLGIHEEGGYTSRETGLKKGKVISYSEFESRFNNQINVPKYSAYQAEEVVAPAPAPVAKPWRLSDDTLKAGPGIIASIKKVDTGLKVVSEENNNKNNILSTSKNNNPMNSIKNAFSFDKLSNDQVALSMTGKIALKSKDGNFRSYDSTTGSILIHSILPTFSIGKFCFKMPTSFDAIVEGDIIIHDNAFKHVVSVSALGIKAVNLNTGTLSNIKKEIHDGLGLAFASKLVTMFGGQQSDAVGAAAFNPMMLAMLAKDGDSFGDGLGDMLPLMMMTQQGGFANGQNPMQNIMMLSALSGKGDLKDSLLPLMMMTGGFGQQPQAGQAANPMQQMLPLMLLGDKGGDKSDLMMMMAMSGGFGGASPFGAPVAPVAPVAAPAVAPVAATTVGVTSSIPVVEVNDDEDAAPAI